MTAWPAAARVVRHRHEHGWWEIAFGRPQPRLRPHVLDYCGYVESSARSLRRREVPFAGVPLIISFGPAIRVFSSANAEGWAPHRSFVAGVDESYALTEYSGEQRGVQVNFTPIGAYLFFATPMDALANRVFALEDVLGADASRLTEQLHEARDWDARFALLDAVIGARLDAARPASPAVAWAWRQLEETRGQIAIGALAQEIGWSRKHLVAQFRAQIGLPPKVMARVLRFRAAVARLEQADEDGMAAIAADCGYFDQAHFINDFRRFAGIAPSEYLRRRLPDESGAILA
jgi:AraC-like DNA-binding protein